MIRPNQPPELEEMERDGEFLAEYAEYVASQDEIEHWAEWAKEVV